MKNAIVFLNLFVLLLLAVGCRDRTASGDGGTTATVNQSPNADTEELVKQGTYLVGIMGCSDCHTPLKMTPQGPAPDMDRYLSGQPAELPLPAYDPAIGKDYILFNMTNTAVIGPWGTSFSANITPDPTGIGNWTEEQFARAVREGKAKGLENGRTLLPPMPWPGFSQLKDGDVKAIYAYLQTIKPVKNSVPAVLPPVTISMQ